eukprot:m51a1_g6136 putative ankyrin repeat-containing protein (1719) ;mRNA; f:243843-250315
MDGAAGDWQRVREVLRSAVFEARVALVRRRRRVHKLLARRLHTPDACTGGGTTAASQTLGFGAPFVDGVDSTGGRGGGEEQGTGAEFQGLIKFAKAFWPRLAEIDAKLDAIDQSLPSMKEVELAQASRAVASALRSLLPTDAAVLDSCRTLLATASLSLLRLSLRAMARPRRPGPAGPQPPCPARRGSASLASSAASPPEPSAAQSPPSPQLCQSSSPTDARRQQQQQQQQQRGSGECKRALDEALQGSLVLEGPLRHEGRSKFFSNREDITTLCYVAEPPGPDGSLDLARVLSVAACAGPRAAASGRSLCVELAMLGGGRVVLEADNDRDATYWLAGLTRLVQHTGAPATHGVLRGEESSALSPMRAGDWGPVSCATASQIEADFLNARMDEALDALTAIEPALRSASDKGERLFEQYMAIARRKAALQRDRDLIAAALHRLELSAAAAAVSSASAPTSSPLARRAAPPQQQPPPPPPREDSGCSLATLSPTPGWAQAFRSRLKRSSSPAVGLQQAQAQADAGAAAACCLPGWQGPRGALEEWVARYARLPRLSVSASAQSDVPALLSPYISGPALDDAMPHTAAIGDVVGVCVTSAYPATDAGLRARAAAAAAGGGDCGASLQVQRLGDPVCDQYAARVLGPGRVVFALADGCNWGAAPREAARRACTAVVEFVSLNAHKVVTTEQAGDVMALAVAYAQDRVVSGHRLLWDRVVPVSHRDRPRTRCARPRDLVPAPMSDDPPPPPLMTVTGTPSPANAAAPRSTSKGSLLGRIMIRRRSESSSAAQPGYVPPSPTGGTTTAAAAAAAKDAAGRKAHAAAALAQQQQRQRQSVAAVLADKYAMPCFLHWIDHRRPDLSNDARFFVEASLVASTPIKDPLAAAERERLLIKRFLVWDAPEEVNVPGREKRRGITGEPSPRSGTSADHTVITEMCACIMDELQELYIPFILEYPNFIGWINLHKPFKYKDKLKEKDGVFHWGRRSFNSGQMPDQLKVTATVLSQEDFIDSHGSTPSSPQLQASRPFPYALERSTTPKRDLAYGVRRGACQVAKCDCEQYQAPQHESQHAHSLSCAGAPSALGSAGSGASTPVNSGPSSSALPFAVAASSASQHGSLPSAMTSAMVLAAAAAAAAESGGAGGVVGAGAARGGAVCQNCGHFPAQHANLNRLSMGAGTVASPPGALLSVGRSSTPQGHSPSSSSPVFSPLGGSPQQGPAGPLVAAPLPGGLPALPAPPPPEDEGAGASSLLMYSEVLARAPAGASGLRETCIRAPSTPLAQQREGVTSPGSFHRLSLVAGDLATPTPVHPQARSAAVAPAVMSPPPVPPPPAAPYGAPPPAPPAAALGSSGSAALAVMAHSAHTAALDIIELPSPRSPAVQSMLRNGPSPKPQSQQAQQLALALAQAQAQQQEAAAAAGLVGAAAGDTKQWLLDYGEITMDEEPLGSGRTASVHKGRWRNQDVAVKVLRESIEQKTMDDFRQEVQFLCSLRSSHFVYFYGVVIEPRCLLVLEYCSHGSLNNFMQTDVAFPWDMVLRFAQEATRGLSYLHNWRPQIVHRDFKSHNLLISDSWQIKITDFGLSRSLANNRETLAKVRGTYAYCCPELYFGKEYTDRSDVYSLSIVLWEMVARALTGEYQRPFAEFPRIQFEFQILLQVAKSNLRPTMPQSCPQELAQLITDCWDPAPERRPSAPEVLDRLGAIEAVYRAKPKKWEKLREKPKK